MPINLQPLDSCPVDYSDFTPTMKRWLSDTVDIINAGFLQLQNFLEGVIAIMTADIGGGGAGPIVVPLLGLTPASTVDVSLLSSSNPVSIATIAAGTNQFTVTFSADPGAIAIIRYVATLPAS